MPRSPSHTPPHSHRTDHPVAASTCGKRRRGPAGGSRHTGRKPTQINSSPGKDTDLTALDDNQVSIRSAIDANMETIRQLERTNHLLAALLPANRRRDPRRVTYTSPDGRVFDFGGT